MHRYKYAKKLPLSLLNKQKTIQNIQMQKNKNSIISFAMQAGLGLGGFWVFKYLFVMGATKYPSLQFVNGFLLFFTPLLLLFYLIQYKNRKADNKLKYWEGVGLGITLFFFAAIIESVIIFFHITSIDPAYISRVMEETIEMAKSLNFNDSMMEELHKQSSLSPFTYIIRQIMSNTFIGLLLSLMLSPLAARININVKKPNN